MGKYRGKISHRVAHPKIFVWSHAEKAEIEYFKEFKNHYNNHLLMPKKEICRTPQQLIEKIIQWKKQNIGSGVFCEKDNDQVWCVFDVDDFFKNNAKTLSERNLKDNETRVKQEVLATKLLAIFGNFFVTPNVKVVQAKVDDKTVYGVASEALANFQSAKNINGIWDEEKFAVFYLANAWINNWDWLGLGCDNFGFDSAGKLLAIDFGGAFDLRADPKNAESILKSKYYTTTATATNNNADFFGFKANAIDSMVDPQKSPNGHQYCRNLSAENIKLAAEKIVSIPDQVILDLVTKEGIGTAEEAYQLAEKLIRRKYYIAARYEVIPRYLNKCSHFEDVANFVLLTYFFHAADGDDSYKQLYNQKGIAPTEYAVQRIKHGVDHSGRTAELITILNKLYGSNSSGEYKPLDDELLKMLKVAALFHDAGRKNDFGGDNPNWEEDGANKAYNFLKNLGYAEGKAQIIKNALINKDNISNISDELTRRCAILLHDADSLEVLRAHNWKFDVKYLKYPEIYAKNLNPRERWSFRKELFRVIEELKITQNRMGDSPQKLVHFESHRRNYGSAKKGTLKEAVFNLVPGNFDLKTKEKNANSLTPYSNIHELFIQNKVLNRYLENEFITIPIFTQQEFAQTGLNPKYLARPVPDNAKDDDKKTTSIPIPTSTTTTTTTTTTGQLGKLPYEEIYTEPGLNAQNLQRFNDRILVAKGSDRSPSAVEKDGGFHPKAVVANEDFGDHYKLDAKTIKDREMPKNEIKSPNNKKPGEYDNDDSRLIVTQDPNVGKTYLLRRNAFNVVYHWGTESRGSGVISTTYDPDATKPFIVLESPAGEGEGWVYICGISGLIASRDKTKSTSNLNPFPQECEYSAPGGIDFSSIFAIVHIKVAKGTSTRFLDMEIKVKTEVLRKYGSEFIRKICALFLEKGKFAYCPDFAASISKEEIPELTAQTKKPLSNLCETGNKRITSLEEMFKRFDPDKFGRHYSNATQRADWGSIIIKHQENIDIIVRTLDAVVQFTQEPTTIYEYWNPFKIYSDDDCPGYNSNTYTFITKVCENKDFANNIYTAFCKFNSDPEFKKVENVGIVSLIFSALWVFEDKADVIAKMLLTLWECKLLSNVSNVYFIYDFLCGVKQQDFLQPDSDISTMQQLLEVLQKENLLNQQNFYKLTLYCKDDKCGLACLEKIVFLSKTFQQLSLKKELNQAGFDKTVAVTPTSSTATYTATATALSLSTIQPIPAKSLETSFATPSSQAMTVPSAPLPFFSTSPPPATTSSTLTSAAAAATESNSASTLT